MLEKVNIMVWVEKRLDFISSIDGSVGNVICEIRKNCEQQSFPQVNQSLFLRFKQMLFKRKF